MGLIEEEAQARIGGDEVTRLHAIQMEISLAIGEQMRQIREKEKFIARFTGEIRLQKQGNT